MNKKQISEQMSNLAKFRWSKTSKAKRIEHGKLMRAKKAEKRQKVNNSKG